MTFPVTRSNWQLCMVLLSALLITACNDEESTAEAVSDEQTAVLIATAQASVSDLPIWLETVGMVHSRSTPTLAAEVEGRITKINFDTGDSIEAGQALAEIDTSTRLLEQKAAQAGLERLEVHIANGERRVKRFETLSAKNLSSQSQLEDAREELEAFRADYKAAQANLAMVDDSLQKSRVLAPVSGLVQQRMVTVGDFVKRGDPLFEITQPDILQARLPFAESLALQIQVGQPAKIYSPLTPGEFVEGQVTELQPSVGLGSRAITAIIDLDNPGLLRPRATLSGRVLVDTHINAVTVPVISIVRRPAGETVYVINNGKAQARLVETGFHSDDRIEIVSGLEGGDMVATDGAAFLTDGASTKLATSTTTSRPDTTAVSRTDSNK